MPAVLAATASTRSPQKPRMSTCGTGSGRKASFGLAGLADCDAVINLTPFECDWSLHGPCHEAADVEALQQEEEHQARHHHHGDAGLHGAPVDGAEAAGLQRRH